MFREWLEYFASVFDKIAIAVPPHYTSQNCSGCGTVVVCPTCGVVLDRDENAAINILMLALEMLRENTRTLELSASSSPSGELDPKRLRASDSAGHAGIQAQGQLNLCWVGEILPGKLPGNAREGKI